MDKDLENEGKVSLFFFFERERERERALDGCWGGLWASWDRILEQPNDDSVTKELSLTI